MTNKFYLVNSDEGPISLWDNYIDAKDEKSYAEEDGFHNVEIIVFEKEENGSYCNVGKTF